MSTADSPSLSRWFTNCGGWQPRHDLNELRRGIEAGFLDAQDEFGMTALMFAAASNWRQGLEELLRGGADTKLRYHRTGETALHMAVQAKNEEAVSALLKAGAPPDAANYWGVTPRQLLSRMGGESLIDGVPQGEIWMPPPRIQNAEHLADHHARFKIPGRAERESMQVGQAVDVYVFGPRSEAKQDAVKIRITAVSGHGPAVRYSADLVTTVDQTHLTPSTTTVHFGPENIASVYMPRPGKKK